MSLYHGKEDSEDHDERRSRIQRTGSDVRRMQELSGILRAEGRNAVPLILISQRRR